ncbi:MAG: cation:proton antiporter [Bacteroidales bacterium]|nr:cation:proton antiporter [Bacteroidales bacterium]
MNSLPPLFLDLAIILMTAGVITIIFKWLKQPLVLGYIVAGFFIGPYFPWFPAITDTADVKVWGDIGIVFLMFALGLDFSVKKLKKVGGTGIITALTELLLMFLTGFTVGHMLDWKPMECVFLGCMISISSTTIIVKSFEDLKLKRQKFASAATAVLVVEDLVAVLLLVLLSTIAVGHQLDGGKLAMSLVKLAFFLLTWFLFGIFLIPTFLRWMRKYMTEETLCIVATGLCFLMVVAASYAGFSTALGAFIMGTILAETIEADVIGRILSPIKNLFGTVFFVSVGMMVDPQVLTQYIVPILAITIAVLVVKPFAATTGILVSGKPLKDAVRSGFCFCNIGEFSFIIAGLGLGYGVVGEHIYSIIVSVSILTTFATPYMIKGALPFHDKVLICLLPAKAQSALARYSANASNDRPEPSLRRFMRMQLASILIYGAIITAIVLLSLGMLKPILNRTFVAENGAPSFWGNLIGCLGTLVAMTPFLWALIAKNVNRGKIKAMLEEHAHSQGIVVAFLLLRDFLALVAMGFVISRYIHLAAGLLIVLTLVATFLFPLSKSAVNFYNRIEDTFKSNFNERQHQQSFQIPRELEMNFHMERMTMSAYSPHVGNTLANSGIRQNYGVNVVSVERAGMICDLPSTDTVLMPQDQVTFLGNDEQLALLRSTVEVEPDMLIHDHTDNELQIAHIVVEHDSPLIGKDLHHSNIRQQHHALVIAIQHGEENITNPSASQVLYEGDVVWYVSPGDAL